jgi:hypothetical protein
MIKVEFFGTDLLYGFHITGHSDMNPDGPEIICAAVSSAAYMAANTVIDVIGLRPDIKVDDGDMYLKLQTESEAERCRDILGGLMLHLGSLSEQYQDYIKLTYSEV